MSDEDTEQTEGAEQHDTGANTSERLDRVEGKLDRLADAVARLIPGSHQEAQDRTERRLERPQRAEDVTRATVREELARAKEDEDRAATEATEKETLQSRLAKLEEKPPAEHRSPLKRFATHGWGGG